MRCRNPFPNSTRQGCWTILPDDFLLVFGDRKWLQAAYFISINLVVLTNTYKSEILVSWHTNRFLVANNFLLFFPNEVSSYIQGRFGFSKNDACQLFSQWFPKFNLFNNASLIDGYIQRFHSHLTFQASVWSKIYLIVNTKFSISSVLKPWIPAGCSNKNVDNDKLPKYCDRRSLRLSLEISTARENK